MKSQIALGLIIWSALVANANGQSTARGVNILDVETSKPSRDASAIDTEPESFNMAGIDESVVSQFSIAWQSSGLGTSNTEGLVLIFRKASFR